MSNLERDYTSLYSYWINKNVTWFVKSGSSTHIQFTNFDDLQNFNNSQL